MVKLFLGKTEDEFIYTDLNSFDFECGHYFTGLHLHGASWSGFADKIEKIEKTILTKEQLFRLAEISKAVSQHYGINKDSEEYNKYLELAKEGKGIISLLCSEENDELYDKLIKEDREYVREEYCLDDEDLDYFYENNPHDYKDHDIICGTYDDTYALGENEAYSYGILDSRSYQSGFDYSRYFDFERFGEDLLEDEDRYMELPSGKILCLSY